jgi:hypothetical protein
MMYGLDAKTPDPGLSIKSDHDSLASILGSAPAVSGNVYVNATANGYLRLRTYDKW